MNKAQILAVFVALLLFCGLYFGLDTKTKNQQAGVRSQAMQVESTGFDALLSDAKAQLTPTQVAEVADLEQQIDIVTDSVGKVAALKRLSGYWYRTGQLAVAGGLAERVAELENADSSWSVAGGTFFNGLVGSQDPKIRAYCAEHAVKAFESAASLNPGKVAHRVNLALVYSENPPPDNPMQAVLMLRELESKHPNDATVYNALGRLAIKTGQWQRAIDRFEKSWTLDKTNPITPCLLAKAYEGAGQMDKMADYAKLCK